jgi:glutaredoxin
MAQKIDVERLPRGAKLELYVSPSCPYCAQAIEFYDAGGIAYVTHDAQNDRKAREAMFGYTNGDPTVPAIVVDGSYVQSGWGTPPRG